MRTSAKIIGVVLLFLSIAAGFTWYAALREDHRGELRVSFLSAGQGDAIYIEAPSGRRILVDGGPDDSILRELGQVMPFYDRSFDIIIASAPTPEKAGGLSSVLSRYSTSVIARTAARSSAPEIQAFTASVSNAQQNGARLLIAQRGMTIDLGGGAVIEVFFPDRDASQMAASDGCMMFKIIFGNTSFFFACGSPAIETYLATLDGSKLKSDVLLATGGDPELFLGFVSPEYIVAPCGSAATSSAAATVGIQSFDTCAGTITFVADGLNMYKK